MGSGTDMLRAELAVQDSGLRQQARFAVYRCPLLPIFYAMDKFVTLSPRRTAHRQVCSTACMPHASTKGLTMTNTANNQSADFDLYLIYVAGAAVTLLLVGSLAGMWLSLSHLAESIKAFTGSTIEHAWAMAITIDVMLIGAELAMIVQANERWGTKIIPVSLFLLCGAMSVGLNVWAFAEHAPSGKQFAMEFAIALGIVLPLAIVLACLASSKVLQKAVPLYIRARHLASANKAGVGAPVANTSASVVTSGNDGEEPLRGKNWARNRARRERAKLRRQGMSEEASQTAQAA